MSDIIEITDFEDPKLDVYARIKEIQLLNRANPEDGIFIAESPKVVERALDAGYEPISILVEKKHVEGEAKQIIKRCGQIPVYTAEFDVLTKITGFKLTRGMLCAMHRRKLPSMREICENAKRIAVLEEVVRVFGHTTGNRIHRIQRTCTEFGKRFLVNQRSEIFIFQHFDLLDFV